MLWISGKGIAHLMQVKPKFWQKAVASAHIAMWQTILKSNDHRLARLQALKSRGVVTQVEVDSVNETRKSLQKALEAAKESKPEPYPSPGRMKRPSAQLT